MGDITGDTPAPPALTAGALNPAYDHWISQDSFIHNLIYGSMDSNLGYLVQHTNRSRDAWTEVCTTYVQQSRGRVQNLKFRLNFVSKGNNSVSKYITIIISLLDELAFLGKRVDEDDLVDIMLRGLGQGYAEVIHAIHARETTITLPDLHKKLITHEASLLQYASQTALPAYTAFPAYTPPRPNFFPSRPTFPSYLQQPPASPQPAVHHPPQYHSNQPWYSPHMAAPNSAPRQPNMNTNRSTSGYLGYCQLCGATGHTATRCPTYPLYNHLPHSQNPNKPPRSVTSQQSPHAYVGSATAPLAPPSSQAPWMLDSGASHHMTHELNLLSMHSPYSGEGFDD